MIQERRVLGEKVLHDYRPFSKRPEPKEAKEQTGKSRREYGCFERNSTFQASFFLFQAQSPSDPTPGIIVGIESRDYLSSLDSYIAHQTAFIRTDRNAKTAVRRAAKTRSGFFMDPYTIPAPAAAGTSVTVI